MFLVAHAATLAKEQKGRYTNIYILTTAWSEYKYWFEIARLWPEYDQNKQSVMRHVFPWGRDIPERLENGLQNNMNSAPQELPAV
ncbi:MAG: hypothetical protein ACRC20_03105 [Segniliparus sp.]|uniref:hypothetical protein n=1 Tax=Segniliparus sp. TaxID=2804064 RepID=UPI003F3F33BB